MERNIFFLQFYYLGILMTRECNVHLDWINVSKTEKEIWTVSCVLLCLDTWLIKYFCSKIMNYSHFIRKFNKGKCRSKVKWSKFKQICYSLKRKIRCKTSKGHTILRGRVWNKSRLIKTSWTFMTGIILNFGLNWRINGIF